MSVNYVDPGSIFGGTWEVWGTGRVPVGVNVSDANFNTVEKTGGAASSGATLSGRTDGHVLTVNEMPSHTHYAASPANLGLGGYAISYTMRTDPVSLSLPVSSTGGNAAHSHTFSGVTANLSTLQPYITCYMWKRIG